METIAKTPDHNFQLDIDEDNEDGRVHGFIYDIRARGPRSNGVALTNMPSRAAAMAFFDSYVELWQRTNEAAPAAG